MKKHIIPTLNLLSGIILMSPYWIDDFPRWMSVIAGIAFVGMALKSWYDMKYYTQRSGGDEGTGV